MKIGYIICFILLVIIIGCSPNLNKKQPLNDNIYRGQETKNMNTEKKENNELLDEDSVETLDANVSIEQDVRNIDAEGSKIRLLENESNEANDNNFIESDKSHRLLIELEYLGSVENSDYSELYIYGYNEDLGFAWWDHYPLSENFAFSKYFEFNLPKGIDRTKKDLVVSYGRKLKYLYYVDEYVPDGLWDEEHYLAHPVFEREYQKNSAHIYLIDKIKLVDNLFLTSEMPEFNKDGNIPFEIPPIE